ncbi:MgtC/SapB family protein [Roseococcus pinisoli]|uniref:Protein MgtC n=1 Tax=Roseococcus pinisoli TaxID=2835040 RepID=A0ABS5QB59_9PROT|nr:MgtC/SapB family protein [Roseococcus pinisoli]MBS7810752.1 MgtC/SapB family protein [Roseococcus pinisoli]
MPSITSEILDILLAFVLGAIIGAEREWRRHPGGLRSCAIVAVASAGYMQLMIEVGGNNLSAGLGALVTGVGFLGAGVILHRDTGVRGLSTAATFWAVAAIGAAAGAQHPRLALALAAAVFFSHSVLRFVSSWIDRHAPPETDDGPH